jgi:hypothetical protein
MIFVRYRAEQGAREVIPRYRVQGIRDQLVGFEHTTSALGLEPLGFLNIVNGKFAQTLELGIVGNWINCRQQISRARARDRFSCPP